MAVKGKFEGYPKDMKFTICNYCKNYIDNFKCNAFLEGVPDVILDCENDHKEKLAEQPNDIVFGPKKR